MVVRRTIRHLRTRPRKEREFVAGMIAGSVGLVLIIIWGYLSVRTLQDSLQVAESIIATSSLSQVASVAQSLPVQPIPKTSDLLKTAAQESVQNSTLSPFILPDNNADTANLNQ